MSEQDKRPLYMGTYERYKKEMQVKHEDVIAQINTLMRLSKYNTVLATIALVLLLVVFVI